MENSTNEDTSHETESPAERLSNVIERVERTAAWAEEYAVTANVDGAYQPSELRRFFATTLQDIANVLPTNKWLSQIKEGFAKRKDRISQKEFDEIILGMRGIISDCKRELVNILGSTVFADSSSKHTDVQLAPEVQDSTDNVEGIDEENYSTPNA